MNCMKCGAKIQEGQVFCDHCLSVMEEYPVKPGVHIHLPKRAQDVEDPKKPGKKKRVLSQEEQISLLQLKVLRLRLAAAVLAFVVCVVSGFLVLELTQQEPELETGRNYTIDTSMND